MNKQYLACGAILTIFGSFLIPITSFINGYPVCLCLQVGGNLFLTSLRIIAAPLIVIGVGLILAGIFSLSKIRGRVLPKREKRNSFVTIISKIVGIFSAIVGVGLVYVYNPATHVMNNSEYFWYPIGLTLLFAGFSAFTTGILEEEADKRDKELKKKIDQLIASRQP